NVAGHLLQRVKGVGHANGVHDAGGHQVSVSWILRSRPASRTVRVTSSGAPRRTTLPPSPIFCRAKSRARRPALDMYVSDAARSTRADTSDRIASSITLCSAGAAPRSEERR